MGWSLTLRKVCYLLDQIRVISDLQEHGYDPQNIEDEDIDRQFQDLKIAGLTSGRPFNVKEVKTD